MSRAWPIDWDRRKLGHRCSMCGWLGKGDNERTVAVAKLEFTEVRLERRSLLPGYCIVAWRHGHVAEPTELDPHALAGYTGEVVAVARTIEQQFKPVKMNYLTLGNWVPHLHTHVVPRHMDDPAAGGPIAWEAMFADEPTDPAVLAKQAAKLRRALSSHRQ